MATDAVVNVAGLYGRVNDVAAQAHGGVALAQTPGVAVITAAKLQPSWIAGGANGLQYAVNNEKVSCVELLNQSTTG